MKASELFEYRLFKNDAGFKIYMNPSAGDIRAILKNSYVLSKLPNVDLNTPIDQLQGVEDDEVYHGGNIHGLDFPLRGIVADGDVYIVDSYDADHQDLGFTLRDQGVNVTNTIHIAIEKQTMAPRGDLEDYMIGAIRAKVNTLKSIPTVTRMKMPIGKWN